MWRGAALHLHHVKIIPLVQLRYTAHTAFGYLVVLIFLEYDPANTSRKNRNIMTV